MSVNKVILVGRLGQNPDVRSTPSGASVANFSIATNESWTDKSGQKQERTEWHRIVVWNRLAELCQQYLSKGRQVYVEGRLQTRQWQDKDGNTKYTTEIMASTIQFLGGQANAGAGDYSQGGYDQAPAQSNSMGGMGAGGGMGDYNTSPNPAAAPLGPTGPGMDSSFTEDDVPF